MVTMAIIVAELEDEKLSDSLIMNLVTDFDQLMASARSHMDAEDSRAHKMTTRLEVAKAESSRGKKVEDDSPKGDTRCSRVDRRDQKKEATKKLTLTSLNTSLSQVLYLIQKEGHLTTPLPRMKSNPQSRDLKQYCRYHRDHDHHTDNCKVL